MESLALLVLCLLAGLALKRVSAFPANGAQALHLFIIYLSLPTLALYYIPHVAINRHLLYPLGVAWMGFLLSFLFFAGLGRAFNWPRRLVGCLVLMGGLSNTSFVGFPIIEAVYGKAGLQTAIIVDQPGSFMVMATLGIIVASAYSKGRADLSAIVVKVIGFPPFVAFGVAIAMNLLHLSFLPVAESVCEKLGATVTPLAMVAVGLQLRVDPKSRHWGFLKLGLLFKLLLMPTFFFVLYWLFLEQRGLVAEVSIMESAMASMITASVVASAFGLKPKLAGMMIGVGIPLSSITLAFWYWVLHF